MNIKDTFGKEIKEIWNRYCDNLPLEIKNREFAVEDEIQEDSLLFIGVNPSFPPKPQKTDYGYYFYSGTNPEHHYFDIFKKISESCGCPFAHHDIYMIRETNQALVKQLSNDNFEFFKEQRELCNRIIIAAKPKAIVIANAYVSEMFISQQHGNEKFDAAIGTYLIDLNGSKIPVFCTSMLSGQRALDIQSRKRLIWHIERTLGKPFKDITE